MGIEAMEVRIDDITSTMHKTQSNIAEIRRSIECLSDVQKEAEKKAEQQWALYSKTIGESIRAEMKKGLEQLEEDLAAKIVNGDSATQLAVEKVKNKLERSIEAGRAELEGAMCGLLCGAADLLGFRDPAGDAAPAPPAGLPAASALLLSRLRAAVRRFGSRDDPGWEGALEDGLDIYWDRSDAAREGQARLSAAAAEHARLIAALEDDAARARAAAQELQFETEALRTRLQAHIASQNPERLERRLLGVVEDRLRAEKELMASKIFEFDRRVTAPPRAPPPAPCAPWASNSPAAPPPPSPDPEIAIRPASPPAPPPPPRNPNPSALTLARSGALRRSLAEERRGSGVRERSTAQEIAVEGRRGGGQIGLVGEG